MPDEFPEYSDSNPYREWQPEPVRESRGGGGCLKGCLFVGVLLLLLSLVGGWYAARNWRGWAVSLTDRAIEQSLAESDLPEEEKQEIRVQIRRVTDAFGEGRITEQQVQRLIDEVSRSPLLGSLAIYGIEKRYFDQSGLSKDEKEAGRKAMKRVVRGAIDRLVSDEEIEEIMGRIATRQPDGTQELKESVTDKELRDFLEACRVKADAVGVPDNVEDVDPSDELRRIIDTAMNAENPASDVPASNGSPANDPDGKQLPAEAPTPDTAPAAENAVPAN